MPQIFASIQNTVKDLIRLTAGVGGQVSDRRRQRAKAQLLRIIDTFPGVYEMLPVDNVPGLGPSAMWQQLYNPDVYRSFNGSVSGEHVSAARRFQDAIAAVIDPQRMESVAGYNQKTVFGMTDPNWLDDYNSYEVTLAGIDS